MRRTLSFLGALLLALPALAGEPVVLPDFTPGSTQEFAVAFMLQQLVTDALERDGHIVLTNAAVEPVVGDAMVACADVPGCPFAPLQQLPSRIGLVVRVVRRDGGLLGEVHLYEQGDSRPVLERDISVVPGQEGKFADEIASMTADTLSLLGPVSEVDLIAAKALVEAANAPPEPPKPKPEPEPEPDPTPKPTPVAEPEPTPRPPGGKGQTLEEMLDGTGILPRHVRGSEPHLRDSELDPRDWMYKAMPHAGRVVLELRGGMGIGDVDRAADVRVTINQQGETVSEWFQEGPQFNYRVRGAGFAGYAPATWVDVGLLIGLQYGVKKLTTGWSRTNGGGALSDPELVQAAQFYFQPRVRFYLAPTGVAKPFLVLGPELRVFDKYHIIDPATVDYPDPYGGAIPGAMAGGGLIIDPGPIVGFFFEGMYTQHFGLRSIAAEKGPTPADAPPPPQGRLFTVGVSGGVQFRI